MNSFSRIALAITLASVPAVSLADTEYTGAGKTGGFFRITIPTVWDGDLVVVNHGFDLNDLKIRPHKTCSNTVDPLAAPACMSDVDCGSGNFCNDISYLGIDQIVLPMNKAIAASTYSTTGWAPFKSAKDIKDILKFLKKETEHEVQRVIITGFSGGGAVTVDATVKLKIDGAIPLCAASAGGLPTWDVAQDVRLVYDFLCDDVTGAQFGSAPDLGEVNTGDYSFDSVNMALKVDKCFGLLGLAPHTPEMDTRLADFLALTSFDGASNADPAGDDFNVVSAMGFATLGLGDFVRDNNRLKGKRIGLNADLDYSSIGDDGSLASAFNGPRYCTLNPAQSCIIDSDCQATGAGLCTGGVKRLPESNGRKLLNKAFNPEYTKGRGKGVDYPIVSMAGAADWLVLPEFQQVFTNALSLGGKANTQTWIDTFGHCVFSEEETTAVFNKFFEWLGPLEGPAGTQPTAADIEQECIDLGGVDGVDCNFNGAFVPSPLHERIPHRADWPAGALP
jgi:hypothetical protein